MHPLKQLRAILASPTAHQGTVVRVADSILVATTQGVQSIARSSGDVTRYGVGDSVRISNGQLLGKRRSSNPPVYVV